MADRTRKVAFMYSGTVASPRGARQGYKQELPQRGYGVPRRDPQPQLQPPPQKKKTIRFIGPEPAKFGDPLTHILEAIEGSKTILGLEEDWDGNGSESYHESTWHLATEFLAMQAAYVQTARAKLPAPDIAPGPSGSIDLVWQEENFRLLINVPRDGSTLGYWGERKAVEVKGHISEPIADHKELFLWLMRTS